MGKAVGVCFFGLAAFFFCLVIAVVTNGIESYSDPASDLGATVLWGFISLVAGLISWFVFGGPA
ncbi:MAG: hypothetical protein KAY24_00380 [Candidatus Eisenbacteria sp.]|nr:hypothetical protein [Candidatus Eisenbacteria bacterium]